MQELNYLSTVLQLLVVGFASNTSLQLFLLHSGCMSVGHGLASGTWVPKEVIRD
jgi:hypothetical protein